MDILEELQHKRKEYLEVLHKINKEDLEKYTRKELEGFIANTPFGDAAFYRILNAVIKEKKEQEYPQLKGVHHYPKINEIDFLTEKEKIDLDTHLSMLSTGQYVAGLRRKYSTHQKVNKVYDWLVTKGIVEEQYLIQCPICNDDVVSKIITKEKKTELEQAFKRYKKDGNYKDYNFISQITEWFCIECEGEWSINDIKEFRFRSTYKLTKPRDTTLDSL